MKDNEAKQVAVVGAGPAGLMAAEEIVKAGHRVTVYDRMPSAGRFMTGCRVRAASFCLRAAAD